MADDLKDVRDQFQSDLDDWSDARTARAKDIKALAGDPWDPKARKAREEAGRPCLSFDELSQHVNQVGNEFRANPLSVDFSPGPPLNASPEAIKQSEAAAELYGDAMREMEYRCNATEVYTTAAENAVQGGYGFVRLVSEFIPGTFIQRLALKAVPDPNTVVPNWDWQKPDLSDMRRCTVLEYRTIKEFTAQFPDAEVRDFEAYRNQESFRQWITDKRILLAEVWDVQQEKVNISLMQGPAVAPPAGSMGFRPPVDPEPIVIAQTDVARYKAAGYTWLRDREDYQPKVRQRLVNGVEVLKETTWPGPYIPIAGCMGRILYKDDDTGATKRLLMSSVRLALEPVEAYNFYRTSEIETVGMITKNPYWAYENQLDGTQQREIAKSLHEPVAVLFAKARTEATGAEILPLPVRNPQSADLAGFSVGAEEARRAILSALGEATLPTSAQRQNEKSKVALDKIEQSRQKGTYHFFDHYKGMVRHVGCLFEAAFDTFHDTKRQIAVRKRDETVAHVWINDPANKDAIDPSGSYGVTVSSGPPVDSTRQAASEFTDNLLGSEALMQSVGPQKAQKIAALAIKLKVKQTGIGAIGEQIVDIIDPADQSAPDPQQLTAHLQQADQLLQMAQQRIKELEDEQQGKIALQQQKDGTTLEKARMDNEVKLAVAELGAKVDRLALFYEERARVGAQMHDAATAAASAGHDEVMANHAAMTQLATTPPDAGAGAAA